VDAEDHDPRRVVTGPAEDGTVAASEDGSDVGAAALAASAKNAAAQRANKNKKKRR